MQAILIAVSDTGGSWVGWVILAVIFGFIDLILFGDMRKAQERTYQSAIRLPGPQLSTP